jgi:hypothetical protein
MVKVYVDDTRTAPEGWVQMWNIRDARNYIEENYEQITHIAFDYYLSETNRAHTGLLLIQYLKYSGLDIFHQPAENYTFHSSDETMNERMRDCLFPPQTESKQATVSQLTMLRRNKGRR